MPVSPFHSTIFVGQGKRLFANPFSFHGRIRRLEFGLSYLIFLFVYIIVDGLTGENEICGLLFIPLYWFLWAQGAKRCHDRGNTGWFQIIPFYGLWMLFGDGEPHENDYGTDPKGRDIVE